MKSLRNCQIFLIICISFIAGYANAQEANPCKTGGLTCYFAVEIDNVLCGYSVETSCDGTLNGKGIHFEYSDVVFKMSALGADIDGGFKAKYAFDPITKRAVGIEMNVINGESVITALTSFKGDSAYFSIPASGVIKVIPIERDVIICSQTHYPHLFDDFIRKNSAEKHYKVFDPIKGEIAEKGYVRKSEERIVLSDSAFQTLVLEETDFPTGVKTTLWLNKADGYNVKAVVAGRRNIYLADKSVTSRITFANIDDELFARVDRKITDIMNISWLRVKALINSYGENLTAQSLNFPGQKFEGSVNGSLIDGIFTVEPARYNGITAPEFPPDFGKQTELHKYLKPDLMIESDDPLIISEAFRITSGSGNSWEAAVRLCRWVAENIAGALPGGISAINTLITGEAECGGHSRLLAAFCRAVGIPARVTAGCMYTAYHSGGFGQHAWTEVFMGNDGWIPVDATIHEVDYIDASHIRLGENATFRPVSMDVLDFRSGSNKAEAFITDDFKSMLGSYMNVEKYRMFKIISKNSGLAIDIPGRTVLELSPPDNQGNLFPKITREISLKPQGMMEGKTEKMIMHEYFRLNKSSPPDTSLQEIPEEFRKLSGNYQLKPARLSLDVMFSKGVLFTQDPTGRSKEQLVYSKNGDIWTDKTGTYQIAFIMNNNYKIASMVLTVITEFRRGEPVTNAVEPVMKNSGTYAGLKEYEKIKNSENDYYLFSVHMLHQTGHNFLKEGRINDAIKVFAKNVKEYPDSFMANDALAEAYMKKGENKLAIRYFKIAVKLNPEYDYGKKMIEELNSKNKSTNY